MAQLFSYPTKTNIIKYIQAVQPTDAIYGDLWLDTIYFCLRVYSFAGKWVLVNIPFKLTGEFLYAYSNYENLRFYPGVNTSLVVNVGYVYTYIGSPTSWVRFNNLGGKTSHGHLARFIGNYSHTEYNKLANSNLCKTPFGASGTSNEGYGYQHGMIAGYGGAISGNNYTYSSLSESWTGRTVLPVALATTYGDYVRTSCGSNENHALFCDLTSNIYSYYLPADVFITQTVLPVNSHESGTMTAYFGGGKYACLSTALGSPPTQIYNNLYSLIGNSWTVRFSIPATLTATQDYSPICSLSPEEITAVAGINTVPGTTVILVYNNLYNGVKNLTIPVAITNPYRKFAGTSFLAMS